MVHSLVTVSEEYLSPGEVATLSLPSPTSSMVLSTRALISLALAIAPAGVFAAVPAYGTFQVFVI